MKCKICDSGTSDFGKATVMGKHVAFYRKCESCGFIFASDPYWLAEAYNSAITSTDMGTVSRTESCSMATKAVIDLFYHSSATFLDYGAGYGMFARRMRDLGYNFSAYDTHCRNMFSEEFALDSLEGKHFDLTTAFEVLEHLEQPMSIIGAIFAHSDHFLATTEIVPNPVPRLEDWWYFAPEHGQHISFYTLKTLNLIAEKNKRYFYSNGNLHLFSAKPINNFIFQKVTRTRNAQWFGLWRRRKSLLEEDFHKRRREVLVRLGYRA
jgi:Methyltransferase domain